MEHKESPKSPEQLWVEFEGNRQAAWHKMQEKHNEIRESFSTIKMPKAIEEIFAEDRRTWRKVWGHRGEKMDDVLVQIAKHSEHEARGYTVLDVPRLKNKEKTR